MYKSVKSKYKGVVPVIDGVIYRIGDKHMSKNVKYITRTITTTSVNITGINSHKNEVQNRNIVLIGKFENNEKLLEICRKQNKDMGFVPAIVTSVNYTDALYGITYDDFLEHAVLLPPRFKIDEA